MLNNTIPSPCFVMDEQRLERNLAVIRDVQDRSGVQIIMALKGFAQWKFFPLIRPYIKAAAASSVHEARLINDELRLPAHTYSPAYKTEDFEEILSYSNHITFNSLGQFHAFYPMIKKAGSKVSAGIRINPEYSEVSTDLYNPCAPGSRLGVLVEQLPDELPEGIEGFHFHSLCENNSYTFEKTLQSFENKAGKYLSRLKWVNFGGGHLMTHKDYDIEHLINVLKDFKNRHDIHVILEPGAAFVWQTGFLLATVVDITMNKGIKTLIMDVSFTAHMPDCLEMPYQPHVVGSVSEQESVFTCRIGGNSCLAGDFMGNWHFKKEVNIGDRLIFEDMMHYTMVKTTMFNGVPHPSIGIIKKDKTFELLRAFGYMDYKNRMC